MQNVFFSWRQVVLKSTLGSTTKHVLLTLGCHMNEMGESCFPSIALLSEETSLSERAVITHLDKAQSAGFISKTKHGFSGQKWSRNEYKATFPTVKNTEKVVNEVHCLDEKVVNLTTEGSEPHDKKVVNEVHTSTSINSTNNNNKCARENYLENNQQGDAYGRLACRLIKSNVSVTSINPTLCRWVDEKIPEDLIFDCVHLARLQKPFPEKIPANYLDTIIKKQLAAPNQQINWMATDERTVAYGLEIGKPPFVGESMQSYRNRLKREAVRNG